MKKKTSFEQSKSIFDEFMELQNAKNWMKYLNNDSKFRLHK